MGGSVDGPTNVQQKTESSQTNPWAPSIPLLGGILDRARGIGTDVTQAQRSALDSLTGAAGSLPNFAGQAGDVASRLFGGGGPNYSGMLFDALGNLKQNLAPFSAPSFLNPLTAPGLSGALDTIRSDITDKINGQFAAAGRDLSGANTQALARGLTQGLGGLVTDQFNRNVGTALDAAKTAFGGAGTTASGATGLNQAELGNRLQGVGVASQIPGLALAPAQAQANAANTAFGLPFQNLGLLSGLVNPIAQLGQSRTGESTTTSQTQTPLWQAITGGLLGGTGLLGQTGAFGQNGWLTGAGGLGSQIGSGLGSLASGGGSFLGNALNVFPAILSDTRIKRDIAPVGETYDGQRIYSYRLRGDPTPRIGLLAQEVERVRPDAVMEVRGLKGVDYGKATEGARAIGMLHDLMMGSEVTHGNA